MKNFLSFIFVLWLMTSRPYNAEVAAVHVTSAAKGLDPHNNNINRSLRHSRTILLPELKSSKDDIAKTRLVEGINNNVVYGDCSSHHHVIASVPGEQFLLSMKQGTNEQRHRELQYYQGSIIKIIFWLILMILAITGAKYYYDKEQQSQQQEPQAQAINGVQQQQQAAAVAGDVQTRWACNSVPQTNNKPGNAAYADTTESSFTENNHETIPVTTGIPIDDQYQQQRQHLPTAPQETQPNTGGPVNNELLNQFAKLLLPNNAEQQQQFINSIAQQYHSLVTSSPFQAAKFMEEFAKAAGDVAEATDNVATALDVANVIFGSL